MVRWLNFPGRRGARLRPSLALAVAISAALVPGAGAKDLFSGPGIGLTPLTVPRTVPPPKTTGVPALDANQCQLMAGTCPLGRLQRSGGRCYCVSGDGTARQGTTRTKPQNARPSLDPP